MRLPAAVDSSTVMPQTGSVVIAMVFSFFWLMGAGRRDDAYGRCLPAAVGVLQVALDALSRVGGVLLAGEVVDGGGGSRGGGDGDLGVLDAKVEAVRPVGEGEVDLVGQVGVEDEHVARVSRPV